MFDLNSDKRELSAHVRPVPAYGTQMEAATAVEEPEESRTLRDYFRIVYKYRWVIILLTITIVSLTALYSLLARPLYTAEATLKIGTYSPSLQRAALEDALRQQTTEQHYLNTQVRRMSSLTLADKVLTETSVKDKLESFGAKGFSVMGLLRSAISLFRSSDSKTIGQEASNTYNNPIKTLKAYNRLLKITPIRKTSLVKISATTSNPEFSALVANTHALKFIELISNERRQITLENLVFLQNQADELARKVATAERELSTYAEENAIVSVDNNENIVLKRMAEVDHLLTAATARRIEAEKSLEEARKGSGVLSTSLDDKAIEQIRIQLKEAQSEYAMLSEKFKPAYPRMVQLRARIDALEENLSQQRNEAIAALEAEFNTASQAEKALKEQLEMQKSESFEVSRRQVQYNIMKRDFDSFRDLHQAVLRQLKEAQVSAESSGQNIVLTDKAAVPLNRSSPRRTLNIMLAIVASPILGFALALVLESLDTTIKTPEEVDRELRLPTLGVVPIFNSQDEPKHLLEQGPNPQAVEYQSADTSQADASAGESESVDKIAQKESPRELGQMNADDLVTFVTPKAIASEAFRSIRTGILLSSADHPPKTLLVTSGRKSEGKTTLATNLAVTLAQADGKTVIIDADLRRPAAHKRFQLEQSSAGLVDLLTGQKSIDDVIYQTPIENLSIIPAGPHPPNPAELVGSRKMSETLDQLSERFDYVIVDSPPILPVTDAALLSRLVDGVVLVVRGHETQKHIARDSVQRLQRVNAKILGVVINDVDLQSGDYYYYRETYHYYHDDAEDSQRKRKRRFA